LTQLGLGGGGTVPPLKRLENQPVLFPKNSKKVFKKKHWPTLPLQKERNHPTIIPMVLNAEKVKKTRIFLG